MTEWEMNAITNPSRTNPHSRKMIPTTRTNRTSSSANSRASVMRNGATTAAIMIEDRGRGRDGLPRCHQNGVGDEGGQKCVEASLDRRAGQSGIGDCLRNQIPHSV